MCTTLLTYSRFPISHTIQTTSVMLKVHQPRKRIACNCNTHSADKWLLYNCRMLTVGFAIANATWSTRTSHKPGDMLGAADVQHQQIALVHSLFLIFWVQRTVPLLPHSATHPERIVVVVPGASTTGIRPRHRGRRIGPRAVIVDLTLLEFTALAVRVGVHHSGIASGPSC